MAYELTNPADLAAVKQQLGLSTSMAALAARSKSSNIGDRQLMNNFATDGNGSAPGKTYHMKNAVPATDVLAVRIVYQNHTAAAIAGIKAIASSSASPSDQYNNAGVWTAATFGGAATGTLPAGTATAPAVLKTDWIPVVPLARSDAGPSTIYHVRSFAPNTNATLPTVGNGGGVSPSTTWGARANEEWSCAVNVGDFVASPTTFTAAGEGSPFAIAIEYMTAATTLTVMNFGDSIRMGYVASAPGNCDIVVAAKAASTPARPISVQNSAQGGSNSDTYIGLAEALIPIHKPAMAVYSVFTPNDTAPTAATIQAQKVKRGRFLKVCQDNGVIPVLSTSVPNTNAGNTASTYSAAVDDLVKALDNDTRALCATGKALLLDLSLILSNTQTAGVARLWKTGLNADGLHPNDAGYLASASDMTVGAGAVIAYLLAA